MTGTKLNAKNVKEIGHLTTMAVTLHAHDWTQAPTTEWHCEKCAKRDRHLRERTIDKLRKQLVASSNPKIWLAKRQGAGRMLRMDGKVSCDKKLDP